jgi:putative iron-regulated protein
MLFSLWLACQPKVSTLPVEQPKIEQTNVMTIVLDNHAIYVSSIWDQTLQSARTMDRSIQAFTTNPTSENLTAAKEAWRNARKFYSQSEAFRFQNGPIDNSETGVEGFLNAWPLDEAYVDYTIDDPNVGIINQLETYPDITKDLLLSLNEKGGERNISLGYHAIEFLLWGQDTNTDGPGVRPVSDYTEHTNASRRIQYLQLSSQILLEHLQQVSDAWKGDYLEEYLSKDAEARIRGIWTGMAMLAGDEMAGERMSVAFETKDQEEEQSCFSDNTLQDFKNNLIGIANIYSGTDQRSFAAILEQQNPELHNEIFTRLSAAFTALMSIPEPFDQSIINEEKRVNVEVTITALENLSDSLVKGAEELGVQILLEGG